VVPQTFQLHASIEANVRRQKLKEPPGVRAALKVLSSVYQDSTPGANETQYADAPTVLQ
jgi:hypothetical protein